jgi:prepilin-type N-terminal cleavage/methylation domain-containing protein
MKQSPVSSQKRAFTLLELLVAMTITALIVASLVSITSIAIDTWNRSRSELRAARQAKSMVDTMARDFEALVTRRGTDQIEWLSAKAESVSSSTSAASLIFFTAATDRYDGEIGTSTDLGGDVSCVGYQLAWKDPIKDPSDPIDDKFETFVLNRLLLDPMIEKFKDEKIPPLLRGAFDLLGFQEYPLNDIFMPLEKSFEKLNEKLKSNDQNYLDSENNFVCENVFQFAVTFHIQMPVTVGTTTIPNKLVTIGPNGTFQGLRIKGTGIVTDPEDTTLTGGRITSVGISLSVLSDAGVEQLRKKPGLANDQEKFAEWLAKNSYQYSKLVQLPGM